MTVGREHGGAPLMGGLTLKALIRELAEAIAECIAERDESLVSQRDRRGLGGRVHIEAVRRRRAEKKDGAYIRGRDYLLTPAALREELERYASRAGNDNDHAAAERRARPPKKTKSAAAAAERDELTQLKRELEADMRAARGR
jgi:hypothetical protein